MVEPARPADAAKWALVQTLPRLCDLHQYSKWDAGRLGEYSDRLPVGTSMEGLTPLFMKKTRKAENGDYNDEIGTATGYQFVTATGVSRPPHPLPYPSLTARGGISLYKKILNNESPFVMDEESASQEAAYVFQHNSRRREHLTLRGKGKQVRRDYIDGKPIPGELQSFVNKARPCHPPRKGQGLPVRPPYSFVYAFNETVLQLTPIIMDRLTNLVDRYPSEFLDHGVCQVALLNYCLYKERGDSLKEKFGDTPGLVSHHMFIIAFHHLLAYTEWTGVAFHPNPFRFAIAFTSHEKDMGRPVPRGYLWDNLDNEDYRALRADIAKLKDVTPVCALTPGDLTGSTVRKFHPSVLDVKPFIRWGVHRSQGWNRELAIQPTLQKLGHVRHIGNPNYLNRKYTHRLIPFVDTKPQHFIKKTYDMACSLKSIKDDDEFPLQVKAVLFPACDPDGYTCGSRIDCLTPLQRADQGRSTGRGPAEGSVLNADLDEVLQLCCSSAEQLEGAVPSTSLLERDRADGKECSAEVAGVINIHEAARHITPPPDNREDGEGYRPALPPKQPSNSSANGAVPKPGTVPKPDKPKVSVNGKTYISQEDVLSYLRAKGHREGVDYVLVDGAPVPMDWEEDSYEYNMGTGLTMC